MLWSIVGSVAIVFITFVILAQFSKPASEAQPAWKNVLHTVEHPVFAFRVVRARIQHKTLPAADATPSAAPSPGATPAPTTAPAAKLNADALAAAKKALEKKAAHRVKVASAGNPAADTGLGGAGVASTQSVPVVPITPAPARIIPTKEPATPAPAAPDVFTDAKIVKQADADYPMIAKDQGIQGTTVVLVTVGSSGHVTSASVAQSSGDKQLDSAAMSAAYRSVFTPATKNGSATDASARLVYTFSL